jgi:hypothetical protein
VAPLDRDELVRGRVAARDRRGRELVARVEAQLLERRREGAPLVAPGVGLVQLVGAEGLEVDPAHGELVVDRLRELAEVRRAE